MDKCFDMPLPSARHDEVVWRANDNRKLKINFLLSFALQNLFPAASPLGDAAVNNHNFHPIFHNSLQVCKIFGMQHLLLIALTTNVKKSDWFHKKIK